MKQTALLALALAAPSMAVAAVNLDKGLTCEMSATAFFSPIVQRRLIDIEPYAVEDSISQFRPRAQIGKNALYAFGMKVETVFGYARDQIMFLRGPGTEPENTYGVVVKEGIANVQAQLNSMGVHRAQTRRISSSRTAITCEGV